jgi:hypothetical protein
MRKKLENSEAYRSGWLDGCYEELECFTENRRLSQWEGASDRLDYYRGHRAGMEARRRSNHLVRAS